MCAEYYVNRLMDIKRIAALSGWLCLNKLEGVTSAQLLGRLKRYLPRKTKVGHAGTLDKWACGVLPVAIGCATKTVPMIMGAEKVYTFKVRWGQQTDTDDRDGQVIATHEKRPTKDEVISVLSKFMGEIDQVPPQYSALKVDGQRASDRVRKNEEVTLASRKIHIYDFRLCSHHDEESEFQVRCSKGTYVRSLARDLARDLGTVGHVSFLRRDQVGGFSLGASILLEKTDEIDDNATEKLASAIIPIRVVLDDIPAIPCMERDLRKLTQGQRISVAINEGEVVFMVDEADVIAIGYVKDKFFYPKNVFIKGED